jgi:hypothetical protein
MIAFGTAISDHLSLKYFQLASQTPSLSQYGHHEKPLLNLAFEESNVTALIISNIGRSRAEVAVKRIPFNPDSNTAVSDELNPVEYYTNTNFFQQKLWLM